MRKAEFLARLDANLDFMEEQERRATLQFYDEQLEDRIDDGMTEEEAVASLESPQDVARNLNDFRTTQSSQAAAAPTTGFASYSTEKKVLVVLGIIFALIILSPIIFSLIAAVFSVVLFIVSIILALALAAIGFVILGIALFTMAILLIPSSPPSALAHLGMSIVSFALAILSGLATYYASYGLIKLAKFTYRSTKNAAEKRKAKKAATTNEPPRAATQTTSDQPVAPEMTDAITTVMPGNAQNGGEQHGR